MAHVDVRRELELDELILRAVGRWAQDHVDGHGSTMTATAAAAILLPGAPPRYQD
jgi:hypothetical protein